MIFLLIISCSVEKFKIHSPARVDFIVGAPADAGDGALVERFFVQINFKFHLSLLLFFCAESNKMNPATVYPFTGCHGARRQTRR